MDDNGNPHYEGGNGKVEVYLKLLEDIKPFR